MAATHALVQEYYGKELASSRDLRTSACTATARPHASLLGAMRDIPREVTDKFYGCGTPLPTGGLDGLRVLDLGCGSGRDCYLASKLVGPHGLVTGVDMTEEQLAVARAHADAYCREVLGYPQSNLRFVRGAMERLHECGIDSESQDLIISNCAINLSPDKPSVIEGMFRVLKFGGEAFFSDVFCDRRLPDTVRSNRVLWGECLAGALYIEDFKRICARVGFLDPRMVETTPIDITDANLAEVVGNAKFYSITFRLFKVHNLETLCEDYGQVATYLGSIPHSLAKYVLDDHHVFEAGRPMLVCGNTASMLTESGWMRKHFRVQGDRSTHFGLFPCGSPKSFGREASTPNSTAVKKTTGGCC